MRFYLGCLVLFAIIIMISIMTTRQKTIKNLDKIDDIEDIITDDLDDKFDLYDSIYEFMTKQNKYLQRIN